MSNLALVIDSAAVEAAQMCTQCLIDAVTEESDALPDKVNDLADASLQRGSVRDGEARYDEAFKEVMSAVLVIAVFTAELSNHRAVAWKDTDEAAPVVISFN
jgi:hypothetical protein